MGIDAGGISVLVRDAVRKRRSEAEALSDYLGAHPELSSEEFESSAKIADIFKKEGFEVEYPYAGYETAFRATLDNGAGASAAIMVEYDALPEIGHGCGHNLHGSLSVLAGLALSELKGLFKGKIHVIGTPAEEGDGAKIGMAGSGIFDDMALAIMMHSVGGGVCQPNMDALSLRCYIVKFHGRPSHAVAAPWEGRSAFAAARKFLDLIDARRECFTSDIHVNGIITDGGKSPSIIPERAEALVEFRTDSMSKLEIVDEMVLKCAKAAAMALDCEVTWTQALPDFADVVRVRSLEEAAAGILSGLGLKVAPVGPPIGSTDVGNVSYRCPAIQPLISVTDEPLALHTPAFAAATLKPEAHESMALGAEAIVMMILKIMNEETFRKKVHDEFIASRGEK
ncbi:MAG: amidohydrolase [Synergistaceae bacterium]|jgi:amidohydrolase|nr:amidohydrolase [Synergistaceae bacterium]